MQDNRKYYIKEKQRRRMNMKRTMFISQRLIFAEREIVNSINISVSTKKINIERENYVENIDKTCKMSKDYYEKKIN